MEMETNIIIKYIAFMNFLKILTCNKMICNSSYLEK